MSFLIPKVVIYYKDIVSNTSYDVPVTKYLNDEREKIDIIIDYQDGILTEHFFN